MDKIDALVLEVSEKMQDMFARLDALDEEKKNLIALYKQAIGEEKIELEKRMKLSEEKYKLLLLDMKKLQLKVEGIQ